MTVVDDRCECCDLPWYSCGTEVAKRQAAEERAVRSRALAEPGAKAAEHAGKCATCGEWFKVGAPIRHTEDGWENILCCG